MNASQEYTAAIIGCGNIAGGLDADPSSRRHIYTHAKAIEQILGLSLVACCDPDESSLHSFAKTWKIPHPYISDVEMLEHERIDICIVSSPTEYHVEHVRHALRGSASVVFCEKPLTFGSEEGHALVKEAAEAGKLLLVNYMRRWDPFYQECRELLIDGKLGEIQTIVAYVDTALYMNSIHMVDMLLWFGGDVSTVTGHLDRARPARIVHGREDFGGVAFIQHENGILSFLKATGETRRNHFFELDVQCTQGRLRVLDDDVRYEVYEFQPCPHQHGLHELALERNVPNSHTRERVVEAYGEIMRYLEAGETPSFSAYEAVKSVEAVEMIYESDARGHVPVASMRERETP